MNHFFESIINLFFPPKCPFCGKVLDAVGVCSKCEKDLPWLPEEQVVMTDKDLTCAAPLWYEGAVREALLRLKFRGGSALAEPFGELLARCAAERFGGEFDTVTWVPVSQKRLEARGYDQSRLLAEAGCKVEKHPLPLHLLCKIKRAAPTTETALLLFRFYSSGNGSRSIPRNGSVASTSPAAMAKTPFSSAMCRRLAVKYTQAVACSFSRQPGTK